MNDDEAAWRAEIASINLARLWRVAIVSIAVWLINAAVCAVVPDLQGKGYVERSLADSGVAALLLILVSRARALPSSSPWRMRTVWLFVAVGLFEMTTWYFQGLESVGQNSDYVLGVILVAVIVLLPPQHLAIALGPNHVLFCIGLLMTGWPRSILLSGLIGGSSAVLMATVVAWLTYRARRAEFLQSRALAAMNAELRDVMAIAAHDLRSPLLGIRDLLRLARREVPDNSSVARALDVASQSSGELARLVTRLVDAHAIQEGGRALALAPHDLRAACREARERLLGTAETKGQRLDVTLPATAAMAHIDTAAFAQVVDNLIGNALKFSPPGAAVECALFAEGQRWCVEVRDEGPSIPSDERDRLFQKFHRGRAKPTGGEASTGLGLFIARRLTEAMGGQISHGSRGQGGSVFRVELPSA